MFFGPKKHRHRVAIFGGSFNPPHIGHSAIVKWIFDKGIADEVLVIPCYRHPFSKELVSFEHRLMMSRLAFGKLLLPILVSDVEREIGGTSFTVNTIEYLKKKRPSDRFIFVTGSDVKGEIELWHQFDKIKALVEVATVPRGKGSPIPDVSSTDIRHRISKGQGFLDLVEREVAVYIVTKGLYRS